LLEADWYRIEEFISGRPAGRTEIENGELLDSYIQQIKLFN
jgi:hypothetical protein